MTARLLAVCAVAAVIAGCGSARVALTHHRVTPAEWKAVFRDWYDDGRFERAHSCAAVVEASAHVPVDGPVYSTLAADLAREAAHVCTHRRDLRAVRAGETDDDVAALAGAPKLPAFGCWSYPGLTVCFTAGRVTRVRRGGVGAA